MRGFELREFHFCRNNIFNRAVLGFMILSGLVAVGCHSKHKLPNVEQPKTSDLGCTSTREYVTALEYLRSKIEIVGSEKQAQLVADQVSKNCTGAARRFINVAELLYQAEYDNATVVKTAVNLSDRSDQTISQFLNIYQKAYLASYLDLDRGAALKLTMSLVELESPHREKDFSEFVAFCLSARELRLSKPVCSQFALRLSSLKWDQPIFPAFQKIYSFLQDGKGETLNIKDRIQVSEKILGYGPDSVDNFMAAYRYATAKTGLNQPVGEALKFAELLASRSVKTRQ